MGSDLSAALRTKEICEGGEILKAWTFGTLARMTVVWKKCDANKDKN